MEVRTDQLLREDLASIERGPINAGEGTQEKEPKRTQGGTDMHYRRTPPTESCHDVRDERFLTMIL